MSSENPQAERDWKCQQMAIINAEYDEAKDEATKSGNGHRVTFAIIAKRHGLTARQLKNWRANHLSPCREQR